MFVKLLNRDWSNPEDWFLFKGGKSGSPPPAPPPAPTPVYEPPPPVEAPKPIPLPDDVKTDAEKQKYLQEKSSASGRASTVYDDEETLG